jgi:p-cumate 2,3-dioxygenase beta subunit
VNVTRALVEDFLFHEADLLDRWELTAWLTLFDTPCEYIVPPPGRPHADPDRDAFLVHDDRTMLEHRVESLLKRSAHAEWPHSVTRRMITNVRVGSRGNDTWNVTANFTVHRMRSGQHAAFIGHYDHQLTEHAGELRFRRRLAALDLDVLRSEGKISIIL